MKKFKAISFSFDDGVEQDKRLIEILDKYDIKATFNVNSGMFGKHTSHEAMFLGEKVVFNNYRIPADEIKEVYRNHEVAAHSINHPILTTLTDEDVIYQVKNDASTLSDISGQHINGLAYPGGYCEYYNERVKQLIMNNTELQYGRTAKSSYSFELPEDMMIFHPTLSHREFEMREKLAQEFLQLETDKPQIFYVWGHSYELDVKEEYWTKFERFCEMIAGKKDIYYGTNDQVFRYFNLY